MRFALLDSQLSEVSNPKLFEKRESAGRVLALKIHEGFANNVTFLNGIKPLRKAPHCMTLGISASAFEGQLLSVDLQHLVTIIR